MTKLDYEPKRPRRRIDWLRVDTALNWLLIALMLALLSLLLLGGLPR